MHAVCLDIDMEAELIPSKTPGHYHLYIEKKLTWENYKKLLEVLAEVEIIEKGYAGASIAKGCTCLRPPLIEDIYEEIRQEALDSLEEDPFYTKIADYDGNLLF